MYSALIIDDDMFNRHVFRLSLEHAGYSVEEAENGSVGMQKLERNLYDIIVLDLHMPGIHGAEVLSWLRSTDSHEETLVLVITANPEMIDEKIAKLANYLLQKPIDVDFLSKLTKRLQKSINDKSSE